MLNVLYYWLFFFFFYMFLFYKAKVLCVSCWCLFTYCLSSMVVYLVYIQSSVLQSSVFTRRSVFYYIQYSRDVCRHWHRFWLCLIYRRHFFYPEQNIFDNKIYVIKQLGFVTYFIWQQQVIKDNMHQKTFFLNVLCNI